MIIDPEREAGVPPVDFVQETYYLLKHLVRKPSDKEQGEFKNRGYEIIQVEPITLLEVIQRDPSYFGRESLDFAKRWPSLREYALPSAMLVAINPTGIYVPESFDKSRYTQLAGTKEHSKGQIEAINSDARSVMPPATVLCQLDKIYFKKTGNMLFANRFGRALDIAGMNYSICVGREHPVKDPPLHVFGRGNFDNERVGAVSAVVFIQQ